MNEEMYIVDVLENVSFERKDAPTVNFHALLYGIVGMEDISRRLRNDEIMISRGRILNYTPKNIVHGGLIASFIQWFGITLANHVKLAGMLCYLHQNGLKDRDLLNSVHKKAALGYVNEYVKRVIPEVQVWRNKIGGHYAFTDPRDDSLQNLQQSIMPNAACLRGRWRSCGMRWSGAEIPEWSPTEQVERLAARYWPHFRFDLNESMLPGSPTNHLWSPGPSQDGCSVRSGDR